MKIREFHDFMNFSWFCYKVSATVFTRCLPLCLPGVWPGVWPGVSPVFDPVLAQCLTRWCQWSDTVVYPVVYPVVYRVWHSVTPGAVPRCTTTTTTSLHHPLPGYYHHHCTRIYHPHVMYEAGISTRCLFTRLLLVPRTPQQKRSFYTSVFWVKNTKITVFLFYWHRSQTSKTDRIDEFDRFSLKFMKLMENQENWVILVSQKW